MERPDIVSQNLNFCFKLEKLRGVQFVWETDSRHVKDKIESPKNRQAVLGREGKLYWYFES